MINYSSIVYKSNFYLFVTILVLFVVSGFVPVVGLFLLVSILVLFSFSKDFLIVAFVWIVLFQNGFIAYSANFIESSVVFKLLHGVSLVIILLFAGLYFTRKQHVQKDEKRLLSAVLIMVGICVVYFAIGMIRYGLISSSVYLRLFITPIAMLVVGFFLAKGGTKHVFEGSMKILFATVLFGTVMQYLLPNTFILLASDIPYYSLKISPSITSTDDVVSYLNANTYLNISWDVRSMRAVGFLKSFISGSYFLVISAILLFWYSSKSSALFIFLIVAVALASKGALLTVTFFLMWYVLKKKLRFSTGLVLTTHVCLIAMLIFVGLKTKNEHVVGFVSGLDYLNTAGNGLGFSGNLSTYDSGIELSTSYLSRFKDGSESVYGVLFSSLGIFAVGYVVLLFSIVRIIYKKFINTRYYYISFLVVIVTFQGIFQEEIFSQYALGTVFLFAGFMFNNNHENTPIIRAS